MTNYFQKKKRKKKKSPRSRLVGLSAASAGQSRDPSASLGCLPACRPTAGMQRQHPIFTHKRRERKRRKEKKRKMVKILCPSRAHTPLLPPFNDISHHVQHDIVITLRGSCLKEWGAGAGITPKAKQADSNIVLVFSKRPLSHELVIMIQCSSMGQDGTSNIPSEAEGGRERGERQERERERS